MSITNREDNSRNEEGVTRTNNIVGPPNVNVYGDDLFPVIRYFDANQQVIIDQDQNLPQERNNSSVQQPLIIPLFIIDEGNEEMEEDVVFPMQENGDFRFQSLFPPYQVISPLKPPLPSIQMLELDDGLLNNVNEPIIPEMERRNESPVVEPLLKKLSLCPPSDVGTCPPQTEFYKSRRRKKNQRKKKKKKKKKKKEISRSSYPEYVPTPPPRPRRRKKKASTRRMSEKERMEYAAPIMKTRSGRTLIKTKLKDEQITGRKRKRNSWDDDDGDEDDFFDGDDEHSNSDEFSDEDDGYAYTTRNLPLKKRIVTPKRKKTIRKRRKGVPMKTSSRLSEQPARKKRKLTRFQFTADGNGSDASGETSTTTTTTKGDDLYQPTEIELRNMYTLEDEDENEYENKVERERRRKKRKRILGQKKHNNNNQQQQQQNRRRTRRRRTRRMDDDDDDDVEVDPFFIPSRYEEDDEDTINHTDTTVVVATGMQYYEEGERPKVLEDWFLENLTKPYPSKTKKAELEKRSNMSTTQVSDWFSNRRKRVWLPAKRIITGKFANKKAEKERTRLEKQNFGKLVFQKMSGMNLK